MGVLCSVIRFENLHELKRLCHWGPIIALGVIAICSTMAMIDSVLWYWPLHTTGGSVNFIMLINWTVMILYNYFNAMFVGPGYVPLKWKPEKAQDSMYLQFCKVCQAYKAPRSHHCRKCNRCVMKMDHHCPWINNCCGYQNHASFTLFLLLAPLGCIHAAFIFVMTMYTQLYNRISFGWNTVKIDMSAVKRDPLPIIPFGLSAFAASLFALGLAVGTTIAVGMLFFIQMKVILRNKTSIESWIEEKAKDRIQYYQTAESFVFPYDMGSRWQNFKQVFTWSGIPEGDGLEWPIREGCHPYSLTIEQLKQKADKRVRSVRYKVIDDYSGACCPFNKGIKTFFTTPCTEEPRISLKKGELILVTRGLRHWMYGDKILDHLTTEDGSRIRGWFPRKCVEKCHYDAESDQISEGEKKNR
ncbi:palmitoyltransferase ZDHHC6 [Sarcophilus harrisii]|uniref:Palmitoyltransferase n=1 Tax=Sarcophilus harrisii TaxID=9305 RepID=A0A7N4NZ04_SARHA|nr:palmitoyltransferase ZDHHC6 [Sarcophilus harrisii]XP_012396610.1 palmitoyltransferase ZDHHC6 [Sarcophilus harrisii]XP_031811717.1 palmitoyltransferase ZDHHC6 [Sarcophilus harrisii]